MVMIGIDPHKGTHTAVAIDPMEQVLGERLVRATNRQVRELLEWAKDLDGSDRIWAIESAGGLGYLLAQQLLAAGETVVDIPATLASRVRAETSTAGTQPTPTHQARRGSIGSRPRGAFSESPRLPNKAASLLYSETRSLIIRVPIGDTVLVHDRIAQSYALR
jgi:hypothetical protein